MNVRTMPPREFFHGVCDHIFTPETLAAFDELLDWPHPQRPDIGNIADIAHKHGARLAPVAASQGWLPRLDLPTGWVNVTKPRSDHAYLDTSDVELVAAFALWRQRRAAIRTKILATAPADDYKNRPRAPFLPPVPPGIAAPDD